MRRVLVCYATREGQTKKIAEHIAAKLVEHGLEADVRNVRTDVAGLDLKAYAAAILAASIHIGRHEREMVTFVKKHRAELDRLPTTLLSVSLCEAGAERGDATPEDRARFSADAKRMIDLFLKQTGWRPMHVQAVAGALQYSKYNPLIRFVMKRIAKTNGASTDTSHDSEYTDWVALDRLTGVIADEVSSQPAVSEPRA